MGANVRPSAFWDEVQVVSIDVQDAITIYNTYEEINSLAIQDSDVFDALNRDNLFWRTQMHCLQAALFLGMSRIFDSHPKARTIHTVLNAALSDVTLFSKQALMERRLIAGQDPEEVSAFVGNAWEPRGAADLRHLKKAL